MTFKHGKFSDSEVLRSLEKVAVSKNLVVADRLTKSASELVRDMEPTHNLSHDIVKLCSELRRSGLHKHADDIEGNFVNYKRAQTLYEAFKETGEDVVDMAHPEGGHVFEDVEGKPEVMTIVERQQAALKMLKKEPTGKLSNAQALRALKLVFAADNDEEVAVTQEDRQKYAFDNVKKVFPNFTELLNLANSLPESISIDPEKAPTPVKDPVLQWLNSTKLVLQTLSSPSLIDYKMLNGLEGSLYLAQQRAKMAANPPSDTDLANKIWHVKNSINWSKNVLANQHDAAILEQKKEAKAIEDHKKEFYEDPFVQIAVARHKRVSDFLNNAISTIKNSEIGTDEDRANAQIQIRKKIKDVTSIKAKLDGLALTPLGGNQKGYKDAEELRADIKNVISDLDKIYNFYGPDFKKAWGIE